MMNFKAVALLYLTFIFVTSIFSVASATEVSAPRFDAKETSIYYVGKAQSNLSGYVRDGAQVHNFTKGTGPGGNAQGRAVCSGSQWNPVDVNGLCYAAGSDTHCNCAGECTTVTWGDEPAVMTVNEQSRCPDGLDYCIFEATDSPGSESYPEIAKTGHDDMFWIIPGGEGFLEYKKCNRLHWMQRTGGLNEPLMIPASCDDYDRFLNDHPADVVYVESACRPVVLTMCPTVPPKAFTPDPPGGCSGPDDPGGGGGNHHESGNTGGGSGSSGNGGHGGNDGDGGASGGDGNNGGGAGSGGDGDGGGSGGDGGSGGGDGGGDGGGGE